MVNFKKFCVRGLIVVVTITGVLFSVTGCSTKMSNTNTVIDENTDKETNKETEEEKGVNQEVETNTDLKINDNNQPEVDFTKQAVDFSVELFKKTRKPSENSLVSPISVLMALSMTANGADGITREEMQQLLASGDSIENLNIYLDTCRKQLTSKDSKLSLANSIWFRDDKDRLTIEQEFLQTNEKYYDAEIFEVPFNKTTVDDINKWVDKHTQGMIPHMVDTLDKDSIMCLINAVVFDAEWENVYTKDKVFSGTFTNSNGIEQDVQMMLSNEYSYIDDGNVTGFIKNYKDKQYSFVALLPNEGISVDEYVESLTGENLLSAIESAQSTTVMTRLPKFEYDYEIEMNEALEKLGLQTAFDVNHADFSKLGSSKEGNIFIGRVLHKSYIAVDELGTKASAATEVEMRDGSALIEYSVTLDRPFVYVIIDNNTKLPIFIGTVMDIVS